MIFIVTDDQSDVGPENNDVLHPLEMADAVMCTIIVPDAVTNRPDPLGSLSLSPRACGQLRDIILGTQSARTAELAQQSGQLRVDAASALETTLARMRQRYALYFRLPPSAEPGRSAKPMCN